MSGPSEDGALAALRGAPGVLAVELDARVALRFAPNDPYFRTDPFTPALGQWGLRQAQVDRAWDVQRGSRAVVVAIVDTGVDPTHPDLVDALAPGGRFLSDVDPSCAPNATSRDDHGHGTHVAGVIGASGNNAQGIAGVAFGVRIMPIKVLDCVGGGRLSDVAAAITHAADHGARVVNVSLGSTLASQALANAVEYALRKNVVVVASAGNCGSLGGTPRCPSLNAREYPAAYAGVLAVGATDFADQPAAFSTAADYVDIAAPGVQILSTFPTYRVHLNAQDVEPQPYVALRGTSQATPFVSGVAALLLSREPALAAGEVVQRLRATADDVGAPGWDARTGDGRVNAVRALTAAPFRYGATYRGARAPETMLVGTRATVPTTLTNTSDFPWLAAGANPVLASSHWIAADGRIAAWDGPRAALPDDVPVGASVAVDVPLDAPARRGTYTVRIDLVQEGVAWFSDRGVAPVSFTVTAGAGYGATYETVAAGLTLVAHGPPATLAVTVTASARRVWPAKGPAPVRLGSHWRDARGALVMWDGPRASLGEDLLPGSSATLLLPVAASLPAGSYTLELDLVHEGVMWFSEDGVVPRSVPVVVTSGGAPSR